MTFTYSTFCEYNGLHVINKNTFGRFLHKLFPNASTYRTQEKYIYKSLSWITNEQPLHVTDLQIPDHCKLMKDSSSIIITIPTKYLVNGLNLQYTLTACLNDKDLVCMLGDTKVNILLYGLAVTNTLENLQANISVLNSLSICMGKPLSSIHDNSKLVIEEWSEIQDENSCEKRCRSVFCDRVLVLTSNGQICTKCRKNVQNTTRKRTSSDKSPVLGPKSPKYDNQQCLKDPEKITLVANDHEDLSAILLNVFPKASEDLKDMLSMQVKNCSVPNNRCHRWSKKVISTCLSLWSRSPKAYQELQNSGLLILPSGRLLQYYKNSVSQPPGFNKCNLEWMRKEATRQNIPATGLRGGLVMDEMLIQDDIQVKKRGDEWELIGAVDMGSWCEALDIIDRGKKECKLATHVLQVIFQGFTGFRWPVAFFASSTAKAHELFINFWEAVDKVHDYGFEVDFVILDGASTNRAFMKMHLQGKLGPECSFTTHDLFNPVKKVVIIQDIMHTIKKIRNGIASSELSNKSDGKGRCLMLDDNVIVWNHWEEAFKYNKEGGLRIHNRLTGTYTN